MSSLLRTLTRRFHMPATSQYSNESWRELGRVLQSEGEKTKLQLRNGPNKWKPFEPYQVLKPHDFTYKSRLLVPPPPLKRPAVAPQSDIARYDDVFHQCGLDPLSQAQNPGILRQFVSEMGKIYGRSVTGLTSKSQRRLGRAIRRAKMMGVIPILSKPRVYYSAQAKNRI